MPRSARTTAAPAAPSVGPFPFTATLWLYQGKGAWHFVTVAPELGEEIRARTALNRRGWGSVKVAATIGTSTWQTSIFPDKKSGSYLLPVKADVRTAQAIEAGDEVKVSLDVFL